MKGSGDNSSLKEQYKNFIEEHFHLKFTYQFKTMENFRYMISGVIRNMRDLKTNNLETAIAPQHSLVLTRKLN